MGKKFKDLKNGDKVYRIQGRVVEQITLTGPFQQVGGCGDWAAPIEFYTVSGALLDDVNIRIPKSCNNKDVYKSGNLYANEEALRFALEEHKAAVLKRYDSDIAKIRIMLETNEKHRQGFSDGITRALSGEYEDYGRSSVYI